MGLWDHRKTWRFRVNATPDDCISAFTRSFGQRVRVWGFWPVKCKWILKQENASGGGLHCLAIYTGRPYVIPKGRQGFLSTVPSEEHLAIGSTVYFEVEKGTSQSTVCSMSLSPSTKVWRFAVADARFIRPYMRRVAKELRSLDPALEKSTS